MDTFEKLERSIHGLVDEYTRLRDDVARTREDSGGTLRKLEEARETIGTLQKTIQELEKETIKHRELEIQKVRITEQIHKIIDKLNTIDSLEKVTNA